MDLGGHIAEINVDSIGQDIDCCFDLNQVLGEQQIWHLPSRMQPKHEQFYCSVWEKRAALILEHMVREMVMWFVYILRPGPQARHGSTTKSNELQNGFNF